MNDIRFSKQFEGHFRRLIPCFLLLGISFLGNSQCSTFGPNPTPTVNVNLDGCSAEMNEAVISGSFGVTATSACQGSPIYFDDDNDRCNTPPAWGGLKPSLSLTDALPDGMGVTCGFTGSIFITYVNNGDPCTGGHAPAHQLNFTLIDPTLPTITCPADMDINACDATGGSHPVVGTTYTEVTFPGTVSDNCGVDNVTVTSVVSSGPLAGCADSEVITVTYVATDDCGNTASCEQVFTYADSESPVITTCPADGSLAGCSTDDLGAPHSSFVAAGTPQSAGILSLFNAMGAVTDNCNAVSASYMDVAAGTCPIVVTRTWTVSDACGNTTSCNQIINITDEIDPTITCPATMVVQGCDANATLLPGQPTINLGAAVTVTAADYEAIDGASAVADNCTVDADLVVSYQDVVVPATCPVKVEIDRTFTVEDGCGNTSTCVQKIYIVDNMDPVITCPTNIFGIQGCSTDDITNVGLAGASTALPFTTATTTITEAQFLAEGGATVADACDVNITYVDVEGGDCSTGFITVRREFTISDGCNTTTCFQFIRIDDTVDPMLTCPAAVTVEGCDQGDITADGTVALAYSATPATFTMADATAEGLVVSDDCPLILSYMDNAPPAAGCPTVIMRTYTATDNCGNSTTCTRNITIEDTVDPVVVCPSDIEVEGCMLGDVTNGGLTALTHSLSAVTITLVQFEAENGTPSITESCNYIITYQDAAPTGTCPISFDRTYTVTDECDNASTCVQSITIDDVTNPEITCPTYTTIEACGTAGIAAAGLLAYTETAQTITSTQFLAEPGTPAVSDNCNFSVSYVDAMMAAADPVCPAAIDVTRTFTVTDDCGNTATCETSIEIRDTTAPVAMCDMGSSPYAVDASCEVTIAAADINDGSTDNCTAVANLTYGVSKTAAGPFTATVTLEEGTDFDFAPCPDNVLLWLQVTDECGNTSVCPTSVNVTDDTDPVAVCPDTGFTGTQVTIMFDYATCEFTDGVLPANSLGDGSSTDNCTGVTETNFEITYNCGNLGLNQTTLFAEDDCGNTNSTLCEVFVVLDQAPVEWCNPEVVCSADLPLDLTGCVVNQDALACGFWTGDDVSNVGIFNPSGPGSYSVTFNIQTANGCSLFLTKDIDVLDAPVATVEDLHVECSESPSGILDLDSFFTSINDSAEGGEWALSSVNGIVTLPVTTVTQTGVLTLDVPAAETTYNQGFSVITNDVVLDIPTNDCETCTIKDVNIKIKSGTPTASGLLFLEFISPDGDDLSVNLTGLGSCGPAVTWDFISDDAGLPVSCLNINSGLPLGWPSPSNLTAMEGGTLNGTWQVRITDALGVGSSVTIEDIDFIIEYECLENDACLSNFEYAEAGCYCFEYTYPAVDFSTCGAQDCDGASSCSTPAPLTACVIISEKPEPSFDIQDQVCWDAQASPVVLTPKCNSPEYSDVYDGSVAGWAEATVWSVQSGPATINGMTGELSVTGTGNVMVCKEEILSYPACGSNDAGSCTEEYCVQIEVSDGMVQDATFTISSQDACIGDVVEFASMAGFDYGDFTGAGVVDNMDGTAELTIVDCSPVAVTYTLNDPNGCTATYTELVHPDRIAPVITPALPNFVIVECDGLGNQTDLDVFLASNGGATATDNCTFTWSYDLVAEDEFCGTTSTYTYEFTATDDCGNTATTQSLFIIRDLTAPTLSSMPVDVVVDPTCSEEVPAVASVTASDVCDAGIAVEFFETTIPGGCEDNFQIKRTWTATDVCGNNVSHTQTITVLDVTAPTFANVPADAAVECSEDVPAIPSGLDAVVATDNCDEVTVDFSEVTIPGGCEDNFTLVRTWVATDACGNETIATQTIVVEDVTAPVFDAPLPDALVSSDCSEDVPAVPGVTATDNCSEVDLDFSEVLQSGTCPNDFTLIRTWIATDLCGNTVSFTQTVRIQDVANPVFVDVPADETGQCASDVPAVVDPVVSDNCGDEVTIDFSEVTLPGECVNSFTVIRTWIGEDDCGNQETVTQTIVINDDTLPVVTPPAAIEVTCADISNTSSPAALVADFLAGASATDNCSAQLVLTHDFSATGLDICSGGVITVTFTAEDECGNLGTATSTITVVEDTEVPVVVPPANIEITCDDLSETTDVSALVAAFLTGATATDNCDTDLVITDDYDGSVIDICTAQVITINFTATDNCGLTHTLPSTITVIPDDVAPVVVPPANLVLDCDDISSTTDPSALVSAFLTSASATDNCDTDPVISHDFDGATLDVCTAQTITVNFTATDHCGLTHTLPSTITIIPDDEAPELTVPANLALDCSDISNTASPAVAVDEFLLGYTVSDNCDTDVIVEHDFSMSDLDVCADIDYAIFVTFTATDNCGNQTTDVASIIVLVDDEDPEITAPAAITLDCSALSSTSSPAATIDAFLAGYTATDDCDTDVAVTHDFDNTALDVCAAADYDIIVTWTAYDNCGNSAEVSSTITVEVDDEDPEITAPAAITLDCGDISPGASPSATIDAFLAGYTVTDDCDTDIVVTHDFDNTDLDVCAAADYDLTVQWTATDNCGNTSQATSTISVVVDLVAPSLNEAEPEDETVMCEESIPGIPSLTFSDACANPVDVDFSEVTVTGTSTNEVVLTRTWVATDYCGNATTVVQVITIQDITNPSSTVCPTDIEVNNDTGVCGATVTYDIPMFTDNCDPNGTIGTLTSGLAPNNVFPIGVTTVTYTFIDDAGNEVTAPCTFTVTVNDAENPTFDNCPNPGFTYDVFTNDCNATANWSIPVASDNCNGVVVAPSAANTIAQGDTDVAPGMYTLAYIATDAAGNTAECTFEVNVIDSENPVISCPDQSALTVKSADANCEFVMGSDAFDATYVENCNTLMSLTHDYTSATSASNNTLNGHTFPLGNTTVVWTAIDESGNSAVCSFIVTVEDTTAPTFDCPAAMNVQGCAGTVPDIVSSLVGADNCAGDVVIVQDPIAGSLFGPNSGDVIEVVVTATDVAGNSSSCTTTITIIDDEMPVFLNCPSTDLVFGNDVDACGATVNWSIPVAEDNCEAPIIAVQTGGPAPGSSLDVGTYTVTYLATDTDGNTAECSFNVVVTDTQCPTLMAGVPVDVTLNCEEATTFERFVMNSTHVVDNCTDPVTDIQNLYVSGKGAYPALCDYYTYNDLYTWVATDEYGNSCNWKQVVSYEDVDAPVLTIPADRLVECGMPTDPSATGMATAVDNCAAEENIDIVFVDVFTAACGLTGVIERTWTATDPCGNVSVAGVQTITIEDNTAPVINNCPTTVVVELDANGEASITHLDVIDLADIIEVCSDPANLVYSLTENMFDCTSIGENEVTLTVTDECGNVSLPCTFIADVQDNILPVLTCPADITVGLEAGECSEQIFAAASVSDNCAVELTYTPSLDTYFEIGTTEVVVTATDAGGNVVECSFDVTMVEFVPSSDEMACNDHINLSLDQNCSAVINADMILEGGNYYCYDNYCIEITTEGGIPHPNLFDVSDAGQTFTVSIIDCANGGTNSCWGTVTIEEKFLPVIACPADVVIPCNQDPELRYVEPYFPSNHPLYGQLVTGEGFVQNCEPGAVITYSDTFTDFGSCDDPRAQVVRTWTVTDSDKNVAMCDQLITIAPLGLNDIVFPQDFTLEMDNAFECKYLDKWDLLIEANGYIGNTELMEDCQDETGYECYGTGYPSVNGVPVQASGNLCNLSMNVEDEIFDICGGSYEILRTWKVRNMCDPVQAGVNPVEYIQVIKIVDTEGPKLVGLPTDLTLSSDPWGCKASAVLPLPTVIEDYCSNDVSLDVNAFGGGDVEITGTYAGGDLVLNAIGLSAGSHQIVYEALDGCHNITKHTMNVTVVDEAPPVAISTQNLSISLTSGSTDANGHAKLFATTVDNGSFDGCTDVKLEIRRDSDPCGVLGNTTYNDNFPNHSNDGVSNPNSALFDGDNGEYVTFCCADAGTTVKVWLRVWDDGNQDGIIGGIGDNFNESWVNVTVEEKLPPVIQCPADLEIECGWDWQTMSGPATAFDNCGEVETELTIQDQTNECGLGRIRATYCTVPTGNESPVCCTQTITVIDGGSNFDVDAISFQRDRTIVCNSVPDAEQPEWGEGLCDLIGWSSEDQDFWFEDGACRKVLRTYSVINWCTEEETTHVTKFVVLDDNAPELEGGVAMYAVDNATDPDEDCDAPITLTQTAYDTIGNCASEWLEWKVEIDLWGDGTTDITYSYAEGADENFQEGRDNDLDGIYYLPKQANGDQVSVSAGEVAHSCNNHEVTWTVNDGCNNITSRTQTFMVVDKKAPTPYCLSVSSAVMPSTGSVELWASDFDLGSSDLCGDVLVSFSDTSYEANKDFSCADDTDGDGVVNVPIYVWDSSCPPNISQCNVELTLSNCGTGGLTRMIAGNAATEFGEMISDVEVTISSDAIINYPTSVMTDDDGNYAFDNNIGSADYHLTSVRNDNHRNGVSTLDLILIQKHLLGIQPLDSPYKVIAADANNSNSVSATDLIIIRKLLLGIHNEYPDSESWRFVDKSQTLTMADPWVFIETLDVMNLNADMMAEDFIGVKVGDVNESVVSNATSISTENRSSADMKFTFDDRKVNAGQKVAIDIYSSNFNEVSGYQFTMDLNGADVANVIPGQLNVNDENVGVFDNTLTMSYSEENARSIASNKVLFTLELNIEKSALISEILSISDKITISEAYVGNELQIVDVKLGIRVNDNEIVDVEGYELVQNEPNPFKTATTINFRLPVDASADLTIYDVNGKLIKSYSNTFTKGWNNFILKKEDILISAGVYYYRLDSDDYSATKKMIVIE